MHKIGKNFDIFFKNENIIQNQYYSKTVILSIIRAILEPLIQIKSKAIIFSRLKNIDKIDSLIKRIEYSQEIIHKPFSDFEFSKFDVEEIGFVVLSAQRYNCAFLFKEVSEDKFEIYLKFNSCLVNKVYETIKSIFLVDYDSEFYLNKPDRRDNCSLNDAVLNILNFFQENVEDGIYNSKLQENYKNVNITNANIRNEIYQNVRSIAHEIKNQLSILDIYTRIFEKKTQDEQITLPIKKSVEVIKKQLEQFKNIDAVHLQEYDIKTILKESIKTYSTILKEKNNKIVLVDEIPELNAKAFVDEEKFSIVVNNVIKNAHDSTKNDEIVIRISKEEEKLRISFINHGDMIKQENQDKIFNLGFTTKKDGWGVGLGVCKKYIGSQFGTFELTKSDENETIFTIILALA